MFANFLVYRGERIGMYTDTGVSHAQSFINLVFHLFVMFLLSIVFASGAQVELKDGNLVVHEF